MTHVTSVASRRLPWAAEYDWLVFPVLLTALNAVVWTAFATIGGNPTLHHDSLEAYVWGREFQLGYYKHPHLWAWIAGGWFLIFPRTDWAFYLLSEGNASLGVLGTWALLGRFTKGPERLAGTLLLLLTTFYTFNALRFNANTIQLSLWPWTMYFFVVSLEKKTLSSGVAFGILAGFAILSKYYAALLLCSCLFAALIHKDRRAYFRSPAPWLAMLVCGLVATPHFIWVVQHQFQPFEYALTQTIAPKGQVDHRFGDTLIGFFIFCGLYHVLQFAVVGSVKLAERFRDESSPPVRIQHGTAFLTTLALCPLELTLLVGAMGYRVTALYVVPIFSLTPFLLLVLVGANATRVVRISVLIYGLIVAGCLMIAPFLPSLSIRMGATFLPQQEAFRIAANAWKLTTSAPLRIVSGSWPYSEAAAFYARGNVSEFTAFNFAFAPWINESRIKREGLLVICLASDEECRAKVSQYQTVSTRVLETDIPSSLGQRVSQSALRFAIIVTPPDAK